MKPSRSIAVVAAILAVLLSLGGAPAFAEDGDRGEALREAARGGDVDRVRELLAAGVDPDAPGQYGATALAFAADKGNVAIMELLIEKGADPNVHDTFYDSTPVSWASYNGHGEAVAFLLKNGATDWEPALNMAIFRGKTEVVRAVLDTVEVTPKALTAALGTAVQSESEEIVAILKAAGAKPPPPTEFEMPAEVMARFAGTYALESTPQMLGQIEVNDGAMTFTFAGQPSLGLEAKDPKTFRAVGGFPLEIRFESEGDTLKGFVLEQEGRPEPVRFLKVQDGPGGQAVAQAADAPPEVAPAADGQPAAAPPKGAADVHWPAFRGPNAAGTASGSPPVSWDVTTGENVAFKTPIPGRGHASPIVWGNRIYVTTAVSSEEEGDFRHGLYGDVDVVDTGDAVYSWRLYALDKTTGEILWHRVAHEGEPRSAHHMKATQANSTPVTDGEHVVAILGSEGLFCWTVDGDLKWRKDLGDLHVGWFYDPSYEWGHSSSPILYDGMVIVQADLNRDPFIAAYSLENGEEVWRTERDNLPSWGTPTLFESEGRVELVTNGSHKIRGYDPKTGEELWHLSPNSEVTVGTPVVGHGLVFVSASYRPIRPIYAIRPGGKGDISLPDEDAESSDQIAWWTPRGGTYMPTPIVYGDHLYTNTNNGIIGCYDARTGEQKYRERIAGRSGAAFSASPVAAGGRLYLSSEDGDIYVVKAGGTFESLGSNDMGEVIMASPAISGDMLYVRTLGHLYGLAEGGPVKPKVAAGR
ncbi:MAG: PQQ-binding-like beta-propeller repeat protein [Acidobacteriota bacterium]